MVFDILPIDTFLNTRWNCQKYHILYIPNIWVFLAWKYYFSLVSCGTERVKEKLRHIFYKEILKDKNCVTTFIRKSLRKELRRNFIRKSWRKELRHSFYKEILKEKNCVTTFIKKCRCFNFNTSPPKTHTPCKSNEDFCKGRVRNFNSHHRQLVLKEFYECEYEITNIEIGSASKSNKKPKRRLTSMNTDKVLKRRKIAEEDPDDMELDDIIVWISLFNKSMVD